MNALLLGLTLVQAPALVPQPEVPSPGFGWTHGSFAIRSDVLGETLQVFVARPPSFGRAERTYPALYLLDGQHYYPEVSSTLAALTSTGAVPEMVLVAIESRDRRRDFTPAGIRLPDVGDEARADAYLDFLETELVPAAEATLHAGWPRVLMGHSHAGMVVLHALARRPQVFPWGIDLDTPVQLEDGFLAHELTRTLGEPQRPALRLVSLARVFGWPDEPWGEASAVARPDDRLERGRLDDETHESMVFAGSYRALKLLFQDASALDTRELAPLEVEARYAGLAAAYGAEVAPPEPLMRRIVEDFLMEGRGARAGEWLERWTRAYGAPLDHDALARRADEIAALGEPTETVAGLLALPPATPEALRDHLGTWRGTSGPEGWPEHPFEVRFSVEDGAVRGEVRFSNGMTEPVTYLQARPDGGLEFGYRNGMRPRGLLVYTEAEPGGPLEGEMLFRGIRFTPPPGMTPPRTFFHLERVLER